MRSLLWRLLAVAVASGGVELGSLPAWGAADSSPIHERVLSNGVHLAVITWTNGKVPTSTNAHLFTFVPMGLLVDEADRTQWAHLVEHLVIRATADEGSIAVNAETLGDHMRLDWSGSSANWQEGLDHHRRWLSGAPFRQESLAVERRKVLLETEFTEKNFATHKFAMAAWNQGVRHRRGHAGVRGAVESGSLMDLQAYRDAHLAVLPRTLVCLVGGVPPDEALDAMEHALGGLSSNARPAAALPGPEKGDVEMTWDLGIRHLILTWPLPALDSPDYAALAVGAPLLMIRLSTNNALNSTMGMPLAGVDLTTPEQDFFYVSAALRPEGKETEVRETLLELVSAISREEAPSVLIESLTTWMAGALRTVPDLAEVRRQAPGVEQSLLEANLGLQWAMQRWRHLTTSPALARAVETLDGAKVRVALERHLAREKARTCWIRPSGQGTGQAGKSGVQ